MFENGTETIEGQKIINISTMGSIYDKGEFINLYLDDGEQLKMSVKEFNKILNDLKFKATPKRKYRHLEITHVYDEDLKEFVKHY